MKAVTLKEEMYALKTKRVFTGEGICRLRSDVPWVKMGQGFVSRISLGTLWHLLYMPMQKISPRLGICQWRGRNPLYA